LGLQIRKVGDAVGKPRDLSLREHGAHKHRKVVAQLVERRGRGRETEWRAGKQIHDRRNLPAFQQSSQDTRTGIEKFLSGTKRQLHGSAVSEDELSIERQDALVLAAVSAVAETVEHFLTRTFFVAKSFCPGEIALEHPSARETPGHIDLHRVICRV